MSDAGPGVVLHIGTQTLVVPASVLQQPQNQDVQPRTYTVKGPSSSQQVTFGGTSIAKLLQLAGIQDSTNIGFLRITRPRDGTFGYLSHDEITNPNAFKDGPALVRVDGDTTHFFRPQRNSKDQNAADNIATTGGAPLVVSAHGGNILKVKAKGNPTTTHAKESVSFSATASGQKKGEKLSYAWHFGDGSKAVGQDVQHTYDTEGGYNAFVVVSGDQDSGGSSDTVTITVGKPQQASTTNPGGSGNSGTAPSTGSGGGSSGTGSGGSGSIPPSTTPPSVHTNQTPPLPLTSIPKTEPGTTQVSGILLASSETVAPGSLLRSPGSPALASTGSTPSREVPIVALTAVLLLGLGAFMEGGRRRFRIPRPWRRSQPTT
ncbi:MAG: PKD domain-containing protein [Thermoleophilaceae bacterium]